MVADTAMPRQQQGHARDQQQRQQARKCLLRIASHNVRGMHQARKLQLLVRIWMELELDVICVQETHVHVDECQSIQDAVDSAAQAVNPHHGGFQVLWACNTIQEAARSAGVAVVVRRALLTQQDMVVGVEHGTKRNIN